jgi:predicted PhzF superfamily epimerase YddE/YHI9
VVCILPEPRDTTWLQALAREMNPISETAFLLKKTPGYSLRWFTPTVEVDLCGHATLASAHVLWEQGLLAPDETAHFHTLSGLLTAKREADWINLDFPEERAEETDAPPALIRALDASPTYVARNRFDYLVEVASEAEVMNLKPNMDLLKVVPTRGVMVTSCSDSPSFDFVSRFFAPAVGIDEDPVTGSAHCCLAPHWQARLGKNQLVGLQASARGGTVRARVGGGRVHLGGQAITIMRGELMQF